MIGIQHNFVFLYSHDLRDEDSIRALQLQFLAEFQWHVRGKLILRNIDNHLFAHGSIRLIGGNCANHTGAHFHTAHGIFKARDYRALPECEFQRFTPFARVEYRPVRERSRVVNADEISCNCRQIDSPFDWAAAPVQG